MKQNYFLSFITRQILIPLVLMLVLTTSAIYESIAQICTPPPPPPTTNAVNRCGVGIVNLNATGTGTQVWMGATGKKVVHAGASYSPYIWGSTTFRVISVTNGANNTVGPINTSIGSASMGNFTGNWQIFNVLNPTGIILDTVDIFPQAVIGSAFVINIEDSMGVMIESVSGVTSVTSGNLQRVFLGIHLPKNDKYRIRFSINPGMNRTTTGAVYPYTLANEITITGNNFDTIVAGTRWYFFYNWKVRTGCYSSTATVTANVNTAPAISMTPSGPLAFCEGDSVSLTGSGYHTYSWMPSTGLNTTSGATVTASPMNTTTYTVVGVDTVTGCANFTDTLVSVRALPTASVVTPPPGCQGGAAIQLNGSGSPNQYYRVGLTEVTNEAYNLIFYGQGTDSRTQVIYTKADLNAAGFTSAGPIAQLGFKLNSKQSASGVYNGFTIRMGTTALNTLTSTTFITTSWTTVFNGPVSTVVGWNDFTFTTLYNWDGNSNILLDVCFDNNAVLAGSDFMFTTQTPTNTVNYFLTTSATLNGCTQTIGQLTNIRPNIRFRGPLTYAWNPATYLSATNIANPLFTPSAAGSHNYTFTVTDVITGCSQSVPTTVNVFTAPTFITQSGPTAFCQGDSVVLTCNAGSGYSWSPGGQTTQSIVVKTSGTYIVTRYSGCAPGTDTTAVLVAPAPSTNVTPGYNLTLCPGDNITLSVPASASYIWSTAQTTQSITISTSGTYYVTVTGFNACSATSQPVNVVQGSFPVVNITQNIEILTANSPTGATYQWYLNGNLIAGATSQNYTPLANGSYTVMVTDLGGCATLSAAYNMTNVGMDEAAFSSVKLYPNPASTAIHFNGLTSGGFVQITDVLGRVVRSVSTRAETLMVDVSGFEKGIYVIRIQLGEKLTALKLVIE